MDDYNPWECFIPDFTPDLLGADVAALPPIAGAAPGIFDEVGGFVGGTILNEFNPVINAIGGQLGSLERQVWGVVQSGLSLAFRFALKRELDAFSWLLGPYWYNLYRQRFGSDNFTAGDMFSTMMEALWQSIETAKGWGLGWLKDRLWEFLGYAAYGFGTLAQLTVGHVNSVGYWVKDRLWEFLGYAAYGFGTLAQLTVGHVSNIGVWVKDRLWEFLGYAAYGFETLAQLTVGHVNSVGYWVKDRLWDFLGYAAYGFGTLAQLTVGHVSNIGVWVKDRLWEFLGYAAYGFGSLAQFIAAQSTNLGTWIYDHIVGPVTGELSKIPGYLLAGAQDIAGFFEEGFKRVFLGPVDEVASLVNYKLSIPGKLYRGEYDTFDQIFDDITDPPPAVLAAFAGVISLPFVIHALITSILPIVLDPVLERPLQEHRQRLGDHLMTPANIHEAWNRGFLPEGEAVELLGRTGYGGQSLEAMKQLRFFEPPVTDLVRFAVREVFTPEISGPFGAFQDLPALFTEHAKRLGLTPEVSSWYWAAHWDLPSATQGFEMLHRRVIDDGTLRLLLRALDVQPYWRDRLIQISYNPLTRVDVRRMYASGVIDEQRVYNAYLDLGYNAENARAITEFVKREYPVGGKAGATPFRDITQAQIRLSYRRHIITRDDAQTRLIETGYDAEEADFLLAQDDAQIAVNPFGASDAQVRDLTVATIRQAYREGIYVYEQAVGELEALGYLGAEADVMLALDDLQVARDLTSARIALVRERYIGFTIPPVGARAQLAGAGVALKRIDLLIAEWDAEREKGSKRLSEANVFSARSRGIFTDDEAFAYLLRLGYNDADAGVLFTLRVGG